MSMMTWVRRIAVVPLLLLGFVCAVGAIRAFTGNLPDGGVGTGVFAAVLAAATIAGTWFLVRSDLRSLSRVDLRRWVLTNPLGQAALLYVAAALVMLPMPKLAILPGFVAQCAYSVLAPASARKARSWWAHAALSVLGFVLLMGALAGTAEALTPRGFGEGGMLFLLPMYVFPILLAVSGIARWVRRARANPANSKP